MRIRVTSGGKRPDWSTVFIDLGTLVELRRNISIAQPVEERAASRQSTRTTAGASRHRRTTAPCAKLLSPHPQCYPFVGVIEGWEFPWVKPVLRTEPMSESETVREQGGWVLTASIANSVLGFGFWALAAHLFSSGAVGIA